MAMVLHRWSTGTHRDEQVFLPAIRGYVPDKMVRAIGAFLEFCYLVRRPFITEEDLRQLEDALDRYEKERDVFVKTKVRKDFSNLPRQHSIFHYPRLIQLFGAPNGLDSSITESKHIRAVKEPYRRSNRFNALGQMLLTNQRMDKLAAARADFDVRGMLIRPRAALLALLAGLGPVHAAPPPVQHPHAGNGEDSEDDDDAVDEPASLRSKVTLAWHRSELVALPVFSG